MSFANLEIEESKHKVTRNGLDFRIGANTDTFYQTHENRVNSVLNQEMHQIQQNVFKGLRAKIFNVRVTLIFNSKIASRVYLGILLHNLKFQGDITYPNSLEGEVNIIHLNPNFYLQRPS